MHGPGGRFEAALEVAPAGGEQHDDVGARGQAPSQVDPVGQAHELGFEVLGCAKQGHPRLGLDPELLGERRSRVPGHRWLRRWSVVEPSGWHWWLVHQWSGGPQRTGGQATSATQNERDTPLL